MCNTVVQDVNSEESFVCEDGGYEANYTFYSTFL